MQGDNSDREQIDRLVRELIAAKRGTAAGAADGRVTEASGPTARTAAPAAMPAGGRWTNVRLLMPPTRTPGLTERFPVLASVGWPRLPDLPALPDLTRIIRIPGNVMMARFWVGLAAIYSTSMIFWPYPKAYPWGLEAYLMCLGLVLVAGIWGARLSWDARLGGAHTVALGSALCAVALAAVEALPPG